MRHCRLRYSNVIWMFKAANGQSRSVKEGRLRLEMILHLEEFSPWPQWLSTGEQVFSLRWMILERPDGFILQLWFKERVDLGPNCNQPKEIPANQTGQVNVVISDHSLRMNESTKKLTKFQNTLKMRGPWGHYTPRLPPELPDPAPLPYFGPTWVVSLTGKKNGLLAGLSFFSFFPPPLLWLCMVWLRDFPPQGGPVVLIHPSWAKGAKFCLQLGRPFQHPKAIWPWTFMVNYWRGLGM